MTTCSCSCNHDDLPGVSWESTPIARKQHVCCECGATIEPGERYHLDEGVWEGAFARFKTCAFCAKIRHDARRDSQPDGPG